MIDAGYLTQRLSKAVLDYDSADLPAEVRSKVWDCVIDNLACGLAGRESLAAQAARSYALETFARGPAPVWFTAKRLSRAGAAWCNAMAASCLDLDDGHRLARGHPGSAIIPAALAQFAATPCSADELETAIAMGYEVAISIAAAQRYERSQTYQSGRWAGFGVVAACGRLARLSQQELAQSFAIAGVWAPNQQANGSSGYASDTGNWAKEGIPMSVMQALMAIDLARHGFSGPLDLFDHGSHYQFASDFCARLRPSLILTTYFKAYACCRYIHPALDAVLALRPKIAHPLNALDRIEVFTFSWALRLANNVRPQSLVDAQYSLPFCLAAVIVHGPQALCPISETMLRDERILDLAERVTLQVDKEIDARFPGQTAARVKLVFPGGEACANTEPVLPHPLCSRAIREKLSAIAFRTFGAHKGGVVSECLRPPIPDLDGMLNLLG